MAAKNDPHFRLRVPAHLKAVLEQEAEKNRRSINAEIVVRLEASLSRDSRAFQMMRELRMYVTEANYARHMLSSKETDDSRKEAYRHIMEYSIEMQQKLRQELDSLGFDPDNLTDLHND